MDEYLWQQFNLLLHKFSVSWRSKRQFVPPFLLKFLDLYLIFCKLVLFEAGFSLCFYSAFLNVRFRRDQVDGIHLSSNEYWGNKLSCQWLLRNVTRATHFRYLRQCRMFLDAQKSSVYIIHISFYFLCFFLFFYTVSYIHFGGFLSYLFTIFIYNLLLLVVYTCYILIHLIFIQILTD